MDVLRDLKVTTPSVPCARGLCPVTLWERPADERPVRRPRRGAHGLCQCPRATPPSRDLCGLGAYWPRLCDGVRGRGAVGRGGAVQCAVQCVSVWAWGHKATDTELTYTPMSQAYGHRHNSLSLSVHCRALLYRSAARTSADVALRSPHEVAIECFLGCVGQLSPTHWRWLVMNHADWGFSLARVCAWGGGGGGAVCSAVYACVCACGRGGEALGAMRTGPWQSGPHTPTLGTARQVQTKQSGERKLLRSCRAALDVVWSVDRDGNAPPSTMGSVWYSVHSVPSPTSHGGSALINGPGGVCAQD